MGVEVTVGEHESEVPEALLDGQRVALGSVRGVECRKSQSRFHRVITSSYVLELILLAPLLPLCLCHFDQS